MKILIKNGEIVTVNKDNDILKGYDVGIQDGRIVHIGDVPDGFNPDRTIDGEGFIVMPGLVNTHTHSSMSLLRNYADDMPLFQWLSQKIWPAEEKLTGECAYWGSMLSIAEMIKSGTTTFNDMYFFMDRVAEAVEETGIRAVLSRGLLSEGMRYDEGFKETLDLYQRFHKKGEGRITIMLGPHAPYTCTPEYLVQVKNLAQKLNVGIHIHISESKGEIEQFKEKHGMTPVKLLNDIGLFDVHTAGAHCVHLTQEDIEILAYKKVNVLNNPTSNLKLGNGFAPVAEMMERGINVSLGTDGSASNNNLDMMEEMHIASIINKGITEDPTAVNAQEAIRMATINGAVSLGLEDEIGSIEIGKKADIILIKRDEPHLRPRYNTNSTIVYSVQGADVDTVIIDGKIIMEDRKFNNIHMDEIIENAERCSREIVNLG